MATVNNSAMANAFIAMAQKQAGINAQRALADGQLELIAVSPVTESAPVEQKPAKAPAKRKATATRKTATKTATKTTTTKGKKMTAPETTATTEATATVTEAPAKKAPAKRKTAKKAEAPAKATAKAPAKPVDPVRNAKSIIAMADDAQLAKLVQKNAMALVAFFRNGSKTGYKKALPDLFVGIVA